MGRQSRRTKRGCCQLEMFPSFRGCEGVDDGSRGGRRESVPFWGFGPACIESKGVWMPGWRGQCTEEFEAAGWAGKRARLVIDRRVPQGVARQRV